MKLYLGWVFKNWGGVWSCGVGCGSRVRNLEFMFYLGVVRKREGLEIFNVRKLKEGVVLLELRYFRGFVGE